MRKRWCVERSKRETGGRYPKMRKLAAFGLEPPTGELLPELFCHSSAGSQEPAPGWGCWGCGACAVCRVPLSAALHSCLLLQTDQKQEECCLPLPDIQSPAFGRTYLEASWERGLGNVVCGLSVLVMQRKAQKAKCGRMNAMTAWGWWICHSGDGKRRQYFKLTAFRKGRGVMGFQIRGPACVEVWKQECTRHFQGTVYLECGVLVEG